MSDAGFEAAIGPLLRHEGGYVGDPRDAGGETKYGISKASYPALDIAALTLEQAKDIYYRDWWLPMRSPPFGCFSGRSEPAAIRRLWSRRTA